MRFNFMSKPLISRFDSISFQNVPSKVEKIINRAIYWVGCENALAEWPSTRAIWVLLTYADELKRIESNLWNANEVFMTMLSFL